MPTPPEKMPPQYDQEIVTRTMEDVYSKIGSLDAVVDAGMDDVYKEMGNTNDRVSSLEGVNTQDKFASHPPMPVPTNVAVLKILPGVFIITCDSIDIIQYPLLEGFQFFASREKGFTPLMETGVSTVTGIHDGGDSNTVLTATAVLTDLSLTNYIDLPFWSDMNLNTQNAIITNTTDSSSATMGGSAWNKDVPLKITTPALAGGDDDTWQDGDGFSFKVPRISNLVGQGPLPFAVYLAPLLSGLYDPGWDAKSLYAKVRTYGKGRYSSLAGADTSGGDGDTLNAPVVSAIPRLLLGHIEVSWTHTYPLFGEDNISKWKVYRTLTQDAPEDDTNIVYETTNKFAGSLFFPFKDTNFSYNQQYYYWVRAVNGDGKEGNLGGPDGALMGKPQVAEIYNNEASGNPLGIWQNWKFQWVVPDGAEGSFIKLTTIGSHFPGDILLGIGTLWIPQMTDKGTYNGEDIQEFITGFPSPVTGETYVFEVQPSNSIIFWEMRSEIMSVEFTVTTIGNPDSPS